MTHENVAARERVIVTLKPNPHDAGGRSQFRIVGPKNNGIQIRNGSGMESRFVQPFLNGVKELKVWAFLNRDGRWHLVDIVRE